MHAFINKDSHTCIIIIALYTLTSLRLVSMSYPATETEPVVIEISPVIIAKVVVLPAPT